MSASRQMLFAAVFWTGLLVPAMAHQGEAHSTRQPAASASARPLQGTATPSSGGHGEMDMSGISPETIAHQLPQPMHLQELDWGDSLRGHVHNKLVHFPLALGLAASLLWLLARRNPDHESAARLLLMGGALIGVASVLTGEAQKGVYDDSPLIEIVGWHEKMGFVSLALLVLGAGWQWHSSWRKVVWPYGIVLVLLMLFTGLLGGIISHGHIASTGANNPATSGHK